MIHKVQAAEHAGPISSAHHVSKRDTAAVDANVLLLSVPSQGVEPTPDIEESESEKVATLTHYLKTMDELEVLLARPTKRSMKALRIRRPIRRNR
ncbi:hypothetical protein CES87_29915 [Pseudomonas sp. ERMR1:02]|nr:hypothetical protein CES87_29915 [Pseudomonas sp. ERMR1:02]